MLTDEVEINIAGGHGGPGKASFFKKGRGPDGGNGGKGGDLFVKTTTNIYALNRFASQREFFAEDGHAGMSNKKSGHDGNDLTITVPIGTDLIDLDTQEIFSLDLPNEEIKICKGGIGGLGNAELKSARMTTPIHAQHGLPGQHRHLKCILKLLANFGLIGLPSSGKSSLLNALTSANAKVGDYPFTTLEPNLGALGNKIIADIPGLIEGASLGRGLGTRFLKHIEKVPVLLHCLPADSQNLKEDYKTIREELGKYNPTLLEKKEILIITKTDLVSKEELKKIIQTVKKINKNVIPVSILDEKSLEKLKQVLTFEEKPEVPLEYHPTDQTPPPTPEPVI